MAETENAPVEQKARTLGWVPKEEFRGDETRWVDAETFVKRGEEIMPLLKANNQRLQSEVADLRGQLTEAQVAITESQEAMKALVEHQSETTLQVVKDTKARLRAQIRAARESQEWEALDELEEQLSEVRDTEKAIEAKKSAPPPEKKPVAAPPPTDPDFTAWRVENPWFGTDKRRTALMYTEAQIMRTEERTALVGRAFYEEAAARADAILNPRAAHSKVDGGTGTGTPSASPSAGPSRTYAGLPADAKAACDKQAKNLVGANRAFKDTDAWRKHYVEQYYLYNE